MSDKRRHNRQRPEDEYPAPGVPADEGWKAMNALLDKKMPPPGRPQHYYTAMWVAALLGILTASGSLLWYLHPGSAEKDSVKTDTAHAAAGHENISPAGPSERHAAEAGPSGTKATDTTGNDPAFPSAASAAAGNPRNADTPEKDPAPLPSSESTSRARQREESAPRPGQPAEERNTSSETSVSLPGNRTPLVPAAAPDGIDGASYQPGLSTAPGSGLLDYLQGPAITIPGPAMGLPSVRSENSGNREAKSEKKTSEGKFEWGLEWAGNIPLTSGGTYFSDLKTGKGHYHLLIPGIWAAGKTGPRSRLLVNVRPLYDYFAGGLRIYDLYNIVDTLTHQDQPKIRQEAMIRKLRSSSAGVSFHHEIARGLLIGTGIAYHQRWSTYSSIRQAQSSTDSLLHWVSSSEDLPWMQLRRGNLLYNLEIGYHYKAVYLGGSMTLPILPLSQAVSGRPLNGQLLIRWRLNR